MKISNIGLAIIVATSIIGCASSSAETKNNDIPVAVKVNAPVPQHAIDLEDNEKWLDAAVEYTKLAESSLPPIQTEYRIKAAQLYLKGNAVADAKASLTSIGTKKLTGTMFIAFNLSHARIALLERDGDAALRWLDQIPSADQKQLGEDFIRMRINGFELAQNFAEAALLRVDLDSQLKSPEDIAKNQHLILQNLSDLPLEELEKLAAKPGPGTFKGWTELAIVLAKNKDPYRIKNLVEDWRKRYADHPISQIVLKDVVPENADQPPPVDYVALLLPFDGPFHKAAVAVRDGFLSAYYDGTISQKKPHVKIYATGANDENVVAAYNQAVESGATVVVGPLNKNGLEQLAKSTNLPVPTLGLNQIEDSSFYKDNLYQFGLPPEDEAKQVAQRMYNDGHIRVAVVFPEGSWGERVFAAFKTRWAELGGEIVISQSIAADKTNLTEPIKLLLAIDKSEKRFRETSAWVRDTLKDSLKFEARRRHDIDAVFMAAFPRQARQIPPLLEFHNGGDLQIYATSHAFTGTVDRSADHDLNNVIIGDMPWTINDYNSSTIKTSVAKLWPDETRQLSRLYALGVDAYQVLFYLNWLRGNPNARLPGATGLLHIDSNNHIQRELTWARFTRGQPRVLAVNNALSQNE